LQTSDFPSLDVSNFGSGGETVVSPLVLAGVFLAGVAILVVPRKYVIWAFLVPMIFIPMGQVVMVSSLHIRMARIITFLGICRVIVSPARDTIRKTQLDRVFVLWAISYSVIFVLRWQTVGAIMNQFGELYDTLAVYCVLRFLIRDEWDIRRVIRVFAVICCMVGAFMVMEKQSGHNPLAFLGGVRELSEVRNGSVRAQGPFGHAILAGVFGATAFPLFVGLWVRARKDRIFVVFGTLAALTMGVTCASSTPLMAVVGCIAAFCLWPMRSRMQLVRRGVVAILVGLQLVMKADVWWLIARVDVTGSSTGWDRAALIDNLIKHFREWWLLGTNNNANWGFSMWDLCVQYVAQGVRGGLLSLILFLTIITLCFKFIGRARKAAGGDSKKQFFIWALGAALFAHVCSFFGTSYFDQNIVAWFTLIAMISALSYSAPMSPLQRSDGESTIKTRPGDILELATVGAIGEQP